MTITKNVWKAAAFLLILSLITAVMISGTYAKYTTEFAGEDTALVAKWEVDGSGGIFTTSGTGIDLNLFEHANYSHMNNTSGSGVYILAPGVADSFIIQFDNNSDVEADITFAVTKTAISADVPILYSFTSPVAIGTSFGVEELESELNSTFGAIAADPTSSADPVSQTVYWSWPYEVDGTQAVKDAQNTSDTALGIKSAVDDRSEYSLVITATAIQVQPE